MKNYILSSVLALFISVSLYAQEAPSSFNEGDVFQIGAVADNDYKHINFPRANFIIKKGGVANYDKVKGQRVVITSIKEKSNGKQVATIKLAGSGSFFNSHKFVTVDLDKAIKNKELLPVK